MNKSSFTIQFKVFLYRAKKRLGQGHTFVHRKNYLLNDEIHGNNKLVYLHLEDFVLHSILYLKYLI